MSKTTFLVFALVSALAGVPQKDAAAKPYWKRHNVTSIHPETRSMVVRESGLEISWDKKTRFLLHRSVRLKDLKQNTVLHVFGKLHATRSLITDVAYIGTGEAYEQPPLTPGNPFIAWHTGAMRSSQSPFYIKVGGTEYRLGVEEDATAYACEGVAPQALASKAIFVRGLAEKVTTETGGKARQTTRVLAREAHLLDLNAKHAKVFQLQWTGERKTGTGLRGDYFDNADLTGLKVSRTDATVAFDWGTGTPDPSIGSDSFSVRWTGQIKAPHTETFTFYVIADDGVRLWVDNQLLIDKWGYQGPTEWTGSIALVAGQKHGFRMEYFDNTFGAVAKLFWSSPSLERQVIPQSHLFPPPMESEPPEAPAKVK